LFQEHLPRPICLRNQFENTKYNYMKNPNIQLYEKSEMQQPQNKEQMQLHWKQSSSTSQVAEGVRINGGYADLPWH